MEDVDLPHQNKLFINKNLCPYHKVLWSKSKKLHSLGKINSFFVSGDTAKIKVSENSPPLSLRILTGKKHSKIKLQRLRKMRIWTFGSLVHQINSF